MRLLKSSILMVFSFVLSFNACLDAKDPPSDISEMTDQEISQSSTTQDMGLSNSEVMDSRLIDSTAPDLEFPKDMTVLQDSISSPEDMSEDMHLVDLLPLDEGIRPEDLARTWTDIHTYIIQPYCEGCHNDSSRGGGLSLTEDQYTALVTDQMRSIAQLSRRLIELGNPEASYFYLKLIGDPSITASRMPLGTSLDEAWIEVIREWIEEGAPR